MSDVANEVVATNTLTVFMQKLYKPVYQWATDLFATKQEVAAATGTTQASAEACEALLDELT